MKILHVAESIKGGCGTYLNQVVPLQIEALGRNNVRVIVPAQHSVQVPDVDPAVVVTYDRPSRSPGSLATLRRTVRRELDAFGPSVVHAQSTFAGAVLRAGLPFGARPRIVYCPHGWVFDTQPTPGRRKVAELVERLLSYRCDAVVAISDYEAEQARRIGIRPDKVSTIYNGIRREPPAPVVTRWDDARRKVLFIGRFDRQKGIETLLAAVGPLVDQVHVRIAGEAIHNAKADQSFPANVTVEGWCSEAELQGLLEKADVVVMPSRWEGFGLVAIEAMRSGVPVFATRVGGLPEVVEDNVTGRLFAVDDASALRTLLAQTPGAELKAMGAAGRERFLRLFTIERTHTALLELYAKVASST